MSIKELQTPLAVITPLGKATCWGIQEGVSADLFWCVFQDVTGEPWQWANQHIRLAPSISDKRPAVTDIQLDDAMKAKLAPHMARHGLAGTAT